MTREEWLEGLVSWLRHLFAEAGVVVPPVRISVGFPSKRALSVRRPVFAECWSANASADGLSQIFVTPRLVDARQVAAIVMHELIHAAFPMAGHTGAFESTAKALGLRGPMQSTTAGPELDTNLALVVHALGPYPHAELRVAQALQAQSSGPLGVILSGKECQGPV